MKASGQIDPLTRGADKLGALGLEAARGAERRLGPALGLRSFRALLAVERPAVAREALRGALRCALALDDLADIEIFAQTWTRCGESTSEVAAICRALLGRGWSAAARRFAEAELQRSDSPRAWYLAGRIRRELGDADVAEAFERAAQLASSQARGGRALLLASRAALAEESVEAGGGDLARAAGEGGEAGSSEGDASQRLILALATLRTGSKFRRASALSALVDLAPGPLGRQAVAAAAAHADAMGLELSWVEAERVEAVIRAADWLDDERRACALRRLNGRRDLAAAPPSAREEVLAGMMVPERGGARHLDLARAVARGEEVDVDELAVAAGVPPAAARALVAVEALRRGDDAAATRPLAALVDDPGDPPVPGAYVAARLALGSPSQRSRGRELVETLLARPGRPRRGWSSLVEPTRQAWGNDLADLVVERAILMEESAAVADRGERLLRQGWAAYQRGDRRRARQLLEEARRLQRRPGGEG